MSMFISSCAWIDKITGGPDKLATITTAVEVGSSMAVSKELDKNPEKAKIFSIASEAISLAIAEEDFTPEEIEASISDLLEEKGLGDFDGVAKTALNIVLVTYRNFYEQNLESKIDARYIAVLKAMVRGIDSAVASSGSKSTLSAPGQDPPNPLQKYVDDPSKLKL